MSRFQSILSRAALVTLSATLTASRANAHTMVQIGPECKSASNAGAQAEPRALLLHSLIVVGMALQGADAMQTAYCLGERVCREANPVMAPFAQHPFWFGMTKLGMAAGMSVAIVRLHQTHQRLAIVAIAAELALETYAVAHNQRLLDRTAP